MLSAGLYGVATSIYMPPLMESYSERYGLFGVTISLVGWLLCISFIVVAATVIAVEFDRAPDGGRQPADAARHRRNRTDRPRTGADGHPHESRFPVEPCLMM